MADFPEKTQTLKRDNLPGRATPAPMPRGKMPPHALELEMAVLGAIMLERDALPKVVDILRDEMFYKPAHQTIYEAVFYLFENSQPVDLIMVVDRLREMGKLEECGGAYYLSELTSGVATAANIEFHSHLLVEYFVRR